MKDKRAVLFDLDGVLVDTAHFHCLAWKKLVNHLKIEGFNDDINERLKGISREESINIILSLSNQVYSQEKKHELGSLKNDWYLGFLESLSSNDILPGMSKLLADLKLQNISIGLVSASKNAEYILEKVGLTHYFEVGIYGQKNAPIKPHPDFFVSCAKELGVDPASCIVIEDAAAGINGAKKAGMKTVGIGSIKNLKNADLLVSSTAELSIEKIMGL